MKFSVAIGTDQYALADFFQDGLEFSIRERSHVELEVLLG